MRLSENSLSDYQSQVLEEFNNLLKGIMEDPNSSYQAEEKRKLRELVSKIEEDLTNIGIAEIITTQEFNVDNNLILTITALCREAKLDVKYVSVNKLEITFQNQ